MTAVDPAGYIALSRERLRGYEPRSISAPDSMRAAVLLLLNHHAGQDLVVLTVRSQQVEHHKGQISFPGGAVHDADKDLQTTALRETWEEIGVRPEDVQVIGRLDDRVTNSNFRVTPFVGVLGQAPYEYVASEIEVGEVIEPPIAHLLDPANTTWEQRSRAGRTLKSPAFLYEGHRIWGATARMLWEYLSLLRDDAEALELSRRDGRG